MPRAEGLDQRLRDNILAVELRRQEERAQLGFQYRLAERITAFTGSMTFVYVHLAICAVWVVINLDLVSAITPFDPSFVILACGASVEAIFLSTFILISQNRMATEADRRADLDLHINLLTEHELTRLARTIDAIAAKLGLDAGEMRPIEEHVDPLSVLDEIARGRRDFLQNGPAQEGCEVTAPDPRSSSK